MTRLPGRLVQSIDAATLATLPKVATYEGPDPELSHLVGRFLPIECVESLVYIGERENVWVEDDQGVRWRPWK